MASLRTRTTKTRRNNETNEILTFLEPFYFSWLWSTFYSYSIIKINGAVEGTTVVAPLTCDWEVVVYSPACCMVFLLHVQQPSTNLLLVGSKIANVGLNWDTFKVIYHYNSLDLTVAHFRAISLLYRVSNFKTKCVVG